MQPWSPCQVSRGDAIPAERGVQFFGAGTRGRTRRGLCSNSRSAGYCRSLSAVRVPCDCKPIDRQCAAVSFRCLRPVQPGGAAGWLASNRIREEWTFSFLPPQSGAASSAQGRQPDQARRWRRKPDSPSRTPQSKEERPECAREPGPAGRGHVARKLPQGDREIQVLALPTPNGVGARPAPTLSATHQSCTCR